MKKLLSICILSVLLTMMSFFTAQAQSSNQCCFWVENMQPETFPHIANLDGTGIAQDTSAGMDLVLNNVLNRAYVGNTDVYTLHFPTGADCGNKVSIEWLVYRDGQLVNGNLSDYADVAIYTRYAPLNANGECQNIDWLGGIVENGDGICGCSVACNDINDYYDCNNTDGHNDFPGARIANALTPPFHDMQHLAAGYTNTMYTYNFDYFYLPFLASEQSSTQFRITWKQVGNYSLVVRLRERLGGTDYTFTYDGSQNPDMYIGGHQSCCGRILAQDSLHYLITTAHEKSICDGETFMYGRGQVTPSGSTLYAFTEESLYYVLFGDYECDHWEIDYIDTLQLYTRINPNIVAQDTDLCRDENFDADDLLNLVTEVDLDAPGIIGHEILWSENNVTWTNDMSRLTSLNNMTVVAGVYKFYAQQVNYYYDAFTGDTIGCGGEIAEIVVNVRDLFPPILEGSHTHYFCNEVLEMNSPFVVKAHLNNLDECSTEIRWYTEDDMAMPTHASTYYVTTGDSMEIDLTALNPENTDFRITYYLYSYNANTGTYSAGYDSVVIQLYQTPEFIVENTQLDYVVCPGALVDMHSKITSELPVYNDVPPTVTYVWYKNGVKILSATDSNYTVNASMVCNEVDTYKVVVTAVSFVGCRNSIARTFTVTAQDNQAPTIAWNTEVGYFDALGNRLDTLSGCDSVDVPAPYTVAQFAAVGTIEDPCSNVDTLLYTDVVSHTTCKTVIVRTYVGRDACGNLSAPIKQIFTLNNDFIPVVTGLVDVDPVRPLHNDCKENAPDYATLRAIFDTSITVTYHCPETTIDTVVFYLENTNVVADGNLDIFADTDLVTIYAVVTDVCGNSSVKTPVFQIHEPAPMYIVDGAITLDTLELCADTNTNMHFNDNFVINAGRPYEYQWSQISVVGQSIITPDPDNYLEAVVSPVNQMINTSTHFVMTVTDVYGCVASDTANAIHFYRLPDVTITDDPRNAGYPHYDGDTVCPNYGNFYVIANGHSNLPDSIPGYQSLSFVWSGAAISLNPYTSTNLFKLACENCDTAYTPIVTVTNKKNCSASAAYTIHGYDGEAPVVTAVDTVVQPLIPGSECQIEIPDFVSTNLYFNPTTVSDNCFSVSEMTFTQDVTPGTLVNQSTVVTVHVHTPCGPDVDHQILVKLPDNTIRITGITADPAAGCEPLTTTLTPTIINSVGTINYNWSNNATTESTTVIATYADHTYTLTVTDASGCSNSMTFEPTVYRVPVAADFEFVKTPNTYCGTIEGDGTVGINVLNDSTAHIAGFSMAGDTHFPYRPLTYTYTDLLAGTYTFTVYTTDGCEAQFTTNVVTDTTDENYPFVLSVLHHNYRCEEPYAGSVQVSPQVENYVYQIISDTHVTDGETQTGLADVITPLMFNWLYQDVYRVMVVSPKHCHFLTDPVTVLNQTDTPTVHTIAIDTVTDCITPNGVLYIYNTNPTYTYTVNGITKPGNNSTLTYAGLSEGDYVIHIVSSGVCHFYQNFHMYSSTPGPERPIATLHGDNYCYNLGANGSITISGANTVAGYTYAIAGYGSQIAAPGATIAFNSLPAGTYTMAVTDIHHCTTNYDYIVEAEPIIVTLAEGEVVAQNGNNCTVPNNKIIITPETGYNYFVTDFVTGDTIQPTDYTQLIDGTYIINKVHAIYGCDHDTSVTVNTVKPVYNYTVNITKDQDCSILGTGVIAVNNPSADYTYTLHTTTGGAPVVVLSEDFVAVPDSSLSEITSSLNSFTHVSGWSGYKVYKANGKLKLGSKSEAGYVQTPSLDLSANGGQFVVSFDAKAWDGDNSNLKVSVDGTDYTFSGLTSTEFTSFNIPLTGGTAASVIKIQGAQNNRGRFFLDNVVVTSQEPVVIDLSDNTLVPGTTPFDSLNAGNYVVVATNNTTNCDYLVNATVELDPYYPVPSAVSTPNIMCTTPKNGTVTITLDSVVPATYYLVADAATTRPTTNRTGLFTQLDSGLYTFYVESDYHCQSVVSTINVIDSAFIDPHFTITPNHSCDSTLNLPGTGCIYVDDPHDDAIHNYTYYLTLPGAWQDHDVDRPSYKWCALSENWYNVDIIDNVTGCEWHDQLFVPFEPVHITMTPTITNNHNCVGMGNGTLTVNAVSDNYDSELYFTIDGGVTVYPNGATINNLSTGDYEIIVIDSAFLCVFDTLSNKDIAIELEKLQMNIDYTVTNNTACDPTLYNGAIVLSSVKYAADNTDVQYTAAITGNAWSGLGAGNYTVTITDNATGCDTSFVVPISTINVCAPVISITSTGHNLHGDYYFCYGEDNGKLIANATSTCDTEFDYEWTSVCAHSSSNTADVDVYTDETFCCWYYVKATGQTTGCSNVDSFYVCVDTLPIIHFLATGPSITLTSGSLTPMAGDPTRPTPNFTNCENKEFTFGIVDPGFDSIIWNNGHVDTNVATFDVPAYSLTPNPDAPTSYCVWVMDHNGCTAGYTAANVWTLPSPTTTVDTAVCNTFHYVAQNGTVYDYTYNASGTNTYTIVDTFAAVNGCDSIVTKNVTINTSPTLTASTLAGPYCHGETLPSSFTYTATDAVNEGWRIASAIPAANSHAYLTDPVFDPTAPLTRSMNGKVVYAFAANGCEIIYKVAGYLYVDSLPIVTLTGTPEFCDGDQITSSLQGHVIAWNSAEGNTYWMLEDTHKVLNYRVVADDNGHFIVFQARNHCGTSNSNKMKLIVHSVNAPTLHVNTTILCAGDALDFPNISLTHNTTATPVDTTYYFDGSEYVLGTPIAAFTGEKSFYAQVDYDCGSPISSNVYTNIMVKDTAKLVVNSVPDTICLGSTPSSISVTHLATNNIVASVSDASKAEVSVNASADPNTSIVEVTPKAVGAFTLTITSQAEAPCGEKSQTFNIFVSQSPVISKPADVVVCEGDYLTLTAPSYTSFGDVYSEGWKVNGADFNPATTPMDMTYNGAKLTYYIENVCGTTTSAEATISVHDTARIAVAVTSPLDTLCVGSTYSFQVNVGPTNILFYSVQPMGSVTFAKTGDEHSTAGAIVTITGAQKGNVTVTFTSKPADNACGGNEEASISFVVSDVPSVSPINDEYEVCEGNYITDLTGVGATPYIYGGEYYKVRSEGWQVRRAGETSFVNFDPTTLMTSAYNNAELRYFYESYCGSGYSDTAHIIVNDTAKLSADANANQEICNGTAITTIHLTTNKPLVLSSELTDAGLSVSSAGDITGTVTFPSSSSFPVYLTGTVSTNDPKCPDYNKTVNIRIQVNSIPTVQLAKPDTICDGDDITVTHTIDNNGAVVTDHGYSSNWTTAPTAHIADNHKIIRYYATNACGTGYSNEQELHVAGHATVELTAEMFRDTCVTNPFSDFLVSGPNVTLATDATVATDTTWYKVVGTTYTELDMTTSITDPTSVACVVKTKCFADTSNVLALTFDKAPEFTTTPPFTVNDFTICEGQKFTKPTLTITPNTDGALDTTWTIDGVELDFDNIYDHASFDGKEVKVVVSNDCGSVEHAVNAIIRELPVPEMLKDTTVCVETPATQFTLSVANENSSSTYKWFGSDGVSVAATATATLSAGSLDTVMTFYVVETDQYGCVSTERINVTPDSIASDVITVKVTSKPAFIFTDMAGTVTHDINSSINNTSTAYKWTVDTKCYSDLDTKVFVNFYVYHNGVLIPNSEISQYLTTSNTTIQGSNHAWNTNQAAPYTSGDGSANRTDMAFYLTMANHYPHSNFGGSSYDFDWLYLHFVNSRYFTNTISQFLQTGDYEIHYELYACDGSELNIYYKEPGMTESKKIGGHNYAEPLTLLTTDVFTIHVDDGPAYDNVEAPEIVNLDPISDEPTVKLYPNPTSDNVNVRIEGVSGQTTIRITTLTGKKVAERTTNLNAKVAVENFNVEDLTPGVYVMQIVNDEAIISRKLVITK